MSAPAREAVSMGTPGLLDSILSRAESPRNDCQIWPGAVDRGYGRIWVDGRAARVHRVVWELKHGAIPDGMTIDHLCRIRACCNTEHMELVTQSENSRRAKHPPSLAVEARRFRGDAQVSELTPVELGPADRRGNSRETSPVGHHH